MNASHIRRVVVCAALIILSIAGAGLFPTQAGTGEKIQPSSLSGAAAVKQLQQDGQYEAVQAAINRERFNVRQMADSPFGRGAWQAPNSAAGYDAYITGTGVHIALNGATSVNLNLQSLGYGTAMRNVSPGDVSGDQQTINIRRDGGVREWYINSPEGLEQGFTLAEPPGAQRSGKPLRLALQVSDGWRAVATEDGQQVTLRNDEGQAVDYGKLVVRDHTGRTIPARLLVIKKQVVIEVEDNDAVYPVTIDPIFTLQQKLMAPDPAFSDDLGHAVAISGDTLIAGAPYDNIDPIPDQGSVYVFVRTGTSWALQQKLTVSDAAPYSFFGSSVAISGNTLIAGAWADDIGANDAQGSAYVFTRSNGVWTQQQKLIASDGADADFFGNAVAIDGDLVAVSAHSDDTGVGFGTDQGSVYIFRRTGTVWTQQPKVTAFDAEAGDYFGDAIALSGNTLAVGAGRDNFNLNSDQGSVYMFALTSTGWVQQQKLMAGDGAKGDFFGWSLALSGNTLAVGAKYDDINGNIDQGSAYIFVRTGTDWMQQQKLTASDGATYDTFGFSIAISGDTVVVGGEEVKVNMNVFQGAAYVFSRSGATWAFDQKLLAYDGAEWHRFGYSVALSGETLAVGSPGDATGGIVRRGSVYVFNCPPPCTTLTFSPAILSDGAINTVYQQMLSVSGGTGPYKFILAGGSLPPGVTLANTGLLSGTPTAAGTYQFRVIAVDTSTGCSASRSYTLTIDHCPTLMLYPQPLPDGKVGTPYNLTLTATGGLAPYKFAVQGTLPPGLTLSTNGVLSGTPTIDGVFEFRIAITDANGCSTVWDCRMVIIKAKSDPCSTIMLEPATLPDGMVDKEYIEQFRPTGGREPYTFVVYGTFPPGLSINPDGYVIGTPTEDGIYSFRLVVSDARGCSRSFEYQITIEKAN